MPGKNALFASMVLAAAVAHAEPPSEMSISFVNPVLWTQQSIEHRGVTESVYRGATASLLSVSKQNVWASLEQGPASSGRRAVVMDLDETVLDNSAFNAWRVKKGADYKEERWQEWMALREATLLPGALDFIKVAKKVGVDLFFISNRTCIEKDGDACPALTHTAKLLTDAGVERAKDKEAFLFKLQVPEWNVDDKSTRRAHVAKSHRIIMLVGDDMGDFLPVPKVVALRAGTPDPETARATKQFGKRWFVIPNPMYGSWQKPLPATAAERMAALQLPKAWQEQAPAGGGAASLKVATWNMAWLANDVLTPAQAQNCLDEAKAQPNMDKRPTVNCRKAAPYRQLADYARMAKHAKVLDADIIGIQEVQGKAAVQNVLDGALAPAVDAGSQVVPGTYLIEAYGNGGWQRVAVAIKRSILDPSFAPVTKEFKQLGDALPRDQRGGLEVTVKLKDGSMLTILSVHLKSRCADDDLNAATDHCPQLAKQAPVLSAWIRDKELAKQPYIVLGDYNRNFMSKAETTCAASREKCQETSLGAWLDEGSLGSEPVVVPTAKLMHPSGCFDTRFSGAAIEHILFGGGAEKRVVPGSAKTVPYLDPATGLAITDHKKAVALYSDHCVVTVDAKL